MRMVDLDGPGGSAFLPAEDINATNDEQSFPFRQPTPRTDTVNLFHVAPAGFMPQMVLKQGTWGEQINQLKIPNLPGTPEAAKTLTWEVALEISRCSFNPGAPSRLNCVFGCEDLDSAKHFRDNFRRGFGIYMCKILDSTTPFHRANFGLLETKDALGSSYIDFYVERCRRYWTELTPGPIEIVCGGAARILDRCE
jgi:hypothetical protein